MKLSKLSEEHYILVDENRKIMNTIPTLEAREVLGIVDVDKKAVNFSKRYSNHDASQEAVYDGYNKGYKQCLIDNKEKKYTEENIRAIFMHGFLLGVDRGEYSIDMENKSLSKYLQPETEWEVEYVDGKLKLK